MFKNKLLLLYFSGGGGRLLQKCKGCYVPLFGCHVGKLSAKMIAAESKEGILVNLPLHTLSVSAT